MEHGVESYAGASVAGTFISFFVATLPIMQWLAAMAALVSAAVAVTWGIMKIRDRLNQKVVKEED
jgi:hypothetical protein